jgi:hypothetical protein
MAEKSELTLAETLRQSLSLYEGLQQQAKEGFTEVIVRDPSKPDRERIMVW